MNNQLATHFRTYFQMDAGSACQILMHLKIESCATGDASALAGAFGLMNLFARSLGGSGLGMNVLWCC